MRKFFDEKEFEELVNELKSKIENEKDYDRKMVYIKIRECIRVVDKIKYILVESVLVEDRKDLWKEFKRELGWLEIVRSGGIGNGREELFFNIGKDLLNR